MRKKWLFLVPFLLLLPLCARAEIRAEAVFTPSDLVMPQDVTLSVSGTNEGAEDVRLCDMEGHVLCDMGDSAVLSYSTPYTVTQDELDSGSVFFLLRFRVNGKGSSTKLTAKLNKMEAAADMRVTRSADMRGENAALLYRIHNTGNVALRDIEIKDPLCGAEAQIENLAAGEKKTVRVVVEAKEETVSQPSVTAVSVFDGKTLRCDLAPLTILPEESAVTAQADCFFSKDGTSRLRVEVTNAGESPVSGIRVTERELGVIGSYAGSFAGGEKMTITRELPKQETRKFTLTVTDAEGNPLAETEVVSVCAGEKGDGIDFGLRVQEAERENGEVTARIVFDNRGETTLRDVALSEARAGELRTVSALPTGETAVDVTYPSDGETAQFFATVLLEDGSRRTAISQTVSVRENRDGTVYRGTLPHKGALSVHIRENAAYPRMLVCILTVLAVLGVLLCRRAAYRSSENRRTRVAHLRNLRRTKRSELEEQNHRQITKEHKAVRIGDDPNREKES